MHPKKLLFLAAFLPVASYAQDLAFGKRLVDTLTSPAFWGRGYTNDGMEKAAGFLATQFESYGLKPMGGKSFLQPFTYPVNVFPGKMDLRINGRDLVPGKDFIVSPESRGVRGKGPLERIDSVQFMNPGSRFVVKLVDKLTWSVAPKAEDYTVVEVDKKAIDGMPESFSAQIENKSVAAFRASNVCAVVPGTARPDSILLVTAHYDHLGGMGAATYFPGANDNASGVSLLLNLARYYATHPQRYTIGFILFAGEEAGLIGSNYFTEHPLVPLRNVRFLTNTDLAGTGEEGITVVNATEYPKEFAVMQAINAKQHLLAAVNARGKAANSDHYFFSEKGVPAFFFYTLGGIKAYHDVFDRAATLP
ncbi:MAG: family peptidase, partial [Flaviaesturariibacter sp.]|nr:family peptidase [Flaviaesturariibacter sp.]